MNLQIDEEKWMPIGMAPTDGRTIIGYDPQRESEWNDGIEFMRWVDGQWIDPATHTCRPVCYLSRPEPPNAEQLRQILTEDAR